MCLLPVRTLLDLSVLPPHEEMFTQGKLIQWQPKMRAVFYVSLEWSSANYPDPGGKRLDVLKRLLTRMAEGRATKVGPDYSSQASFRKSLKITSADWRELANNAHVWIRFCSAPTVSSESIETALRFFPAYVGRSTHFWALCCPPTKYLSDSNLTCELRSCCARGTVRVELSALLMAVTPKPVMLITGGDSPTPAIDVSRFEISLLPGQGRFSYCACEHMRINDDGVSMPIPCERLVAGQTMSHLLERRVDHHRRRGEWNETRLWMVDGLLASLSLGTGN